MSTLISIFPNVIPTAPAAPAVDTTFAIDEFLHAEQAKDLLRFSTAGSVDDGKSTLIGRLLYDSRNVYEDQLRAVTGKTGVEAGTCQVCPADAALRWKNITEGIASSTDDRCLILCQVYR